MVEIKNGLFYGSKYIFAENDILDNLEFRFYKSQYPDENYRIGQKKLSGRVDKITQPNKNSIVLSMDNSDLYSRNCTETTIDVSYLEQTKTKMIVICGSKVDIQIPVTDYRMLDDNVLVKPVLSNDDTIYKCGDIVTLKVISGADTNILLTGKIYTIFHKYTSSITGLTATAYTILDMSTRYRAKLQKVDIDSIIEVIPGE